MRRARITYQGAFHHAMNRGIEGRNIFQKKKYKEKFLELLVSKKERLKIRIFSYCIMDNHYHLVVENSSGRMSEFFKQLNSQYATFFRTQVGGKGYVFQDRFNSTLIQDDSYLQQAIAYILRNPVRAGICSNAYDYKWSSTTAYFSNGIKDKIVDNVFVDELFGSRNSFNQRLELSQELPILKTRYGQILGEESFIKTALKKSNRRQETQSMERKRQDDRYFESVQKVIREFESSNSLKIEEINIAEYTGKRLRGELLLRLKDLAGLTYPEIAKYDLFADIQAHSLGRLYKYAKEKRSKGS